MNNNTETLQIFNIHSEIEVSLSLLDEGLAILNKDFLEDKDIFNIMLFIGNSFERLFKLIIYLSGKHQETLKQNTHNLNTLFEKVKSIYNKMENNVPALQEDKLLINNKNSETLKLMTILSDFLSGGRYYNLDCLIKKNSTDKNNYIVDFEKYSMQIYNKNFTMDFSDTNKMLSNQRQVNKIIKRDIEIFIRALLRLFTFSGSPLQEEGKKFFGIISKHLTK